VPVKLTVVAGPHAGQVFPLADRDTFLVGRTTDCHFRLAYDDPYLSDRHFLIEVSAPRCRVIDLESRNGIRVNGHKVLTAELASGDEVRAGQTVLQLSLVPVAVEAPPAKPAPRVKQAESPPAAPAVPGYEIDKEIGSGVRGVVYRATRKADGERVAIKVVRPAPGVALGNVERFLQEARVLKDVHEGNLVRLLDVGAVGPIPHLVMECLSGPSVEQVVREKGPLPVRTAVLAVAHALTGLSRLHAGGRVHGDIKPANLVIDKTGDKRVVKLADFGVAWAYEEAGLGGPNLWGDAGRPLGFTAPEQITHLRGAGSAADQYAAAATLYYLLTGRLPHDLPEESDRALAMIVSADPAPVRTRRGDLPESIEALLVRALNRDPAARFPNMSAFRSELAEIGRLCGSSSAGSSVPG
jgi:eukaryotic-like serine/threonine-protein kinase